MEQEIASQIVGLGGGFRFYVVESFQESRLCSKICNYTFDREFHIFMGFNF